MQGSASIAPPTHCVAHISTPPRNNRHGYVVTPTIRHHYSPLAGTSAAVIEGREINLCFSGRDGDGSDQDRGRNGWV